MSKVIQLEGAESRTQVSKTPTKRPVHRAVRLQGAVLCIETTTTTQGKTQFPVVSKWALVVCRGAEVWLEDAINFSPWADGRIARRREGPILTSGGKHGQKDTAGAQGQILILPQTTCQGRRLRPACGVSLPGLKGIGVES